MNQQQYQTDAQQNVPDSGNTGNGGVHPGGKLGSQHLHNSSQHKHNAGQIQTNVIDQYSPTCFGAGEGKFFSSNRSIRKNTIPSRK